MHHLHAAFRQLAAGKEPATDPAAAAGEAFAESGLGGILPELVSPFARRFGILGESARYSDRNVTSTFGGPAVGSFVDLYDVLYNRTQGGLSAADLQAVRRLLPLQNLWWARRAINALEGETAEALDLKGAEPMTFGASRWNRGRLSAVMPILPYHSASNAISPISGKSFFSARRAQALWIAVPVPRRAPTLPKTSRPSLS